MLYADAATKRNRYEALKAALWTERSSFDSEWADLSAWTQPRRTRFQVSDRNKGGGSRNKNIINSTARFSLRTLQSGMHAGMTSPARPWMRLTTPDPSLAKFRPVKIWLHAVTQLMLNVFQQTNLYNALPILYGDMGLFGTGCLSVVADSKDLFRCYNYPLGSYALGLDARGVVSTFVREYQLSVRRVVEEFGLAADGRTIDWTILSRTVKTLWDRGAYESPVDLTWVVTPNEEARPDRLASKYLPFASCHFERGVTENKFLRESGFQTFPFLAPRWDITGEDTYGTDCPGMMALGDVKQLQFMERKKGQTIAKSLDPPLIGPSALRTQKTSLLPGDITYQDIREGMQGLSPIHEVRLDGLQFLTADIGEVQYRIQRAFFEDLFLMLARSDDRRGSQPPTAREVDERHEEKLIAVGPVLDRTKDEALEPLVDRAYDMMDGAGFFNADALPPPPELEGIKLKVEYTSIMAEAQKLIGVVGQDRFMISVGQMATTGFPDVADKVDTDQVVDNYGEMLGVDPRIVRSTEDAQAIRAERQQAMQAQAEAEQAQLLARAAKDASQAPLEGDTALTRIAEGVGA